MIFGFCGTLGSGKGTAIELLQKEFSAASFSLSDEIRQECRKRDLGLERTNLIAVGNEMRKKEGDGYWATKAATRAKAMPGWQKRVTTIDSIRLPAEVEALAKEFGNNFVLISVDAPVEIRFERIKKRARAGEQLLTLEQFKASEQKEQSKAKGEPNLAATMALADYEIVNDESRAELERGIRIIANKYHQKAN
ncbi:MAG: AAA family ATPase [Candidatus Micrarchaeia archaeon]|jgi:dephospho-CoA kinase